VKPRELERALKKEPGNLALRLQLAAAYQADGRGAEALAQYRAVAVAYRDEGRLQQAVAVARQALALAPDDAELRALASPPAKPERPVSAPVTPNANPLPRPAPDPRTRARVLESAVPVRELEPMRASPPSEPTPSRTPSGMYTPTPLPMPIAYHDADPSRVHGPHGLRALAEETDPGGGDSFVETLPEPPLSTLAKLRASDQGIPVVLDGEDLSTEMETRKRPRVDQATLDHLGIPPTGQLPKLDDDNEPTIPPAEPGFPPARIERAVARLDDDAWSEEPTDPRGGFDARPPSGVFDRPLGLTVAALGPDGTPVTAAGSGFAGLPEPVRAALVGAAEVRTIAAGTLVVREGEPGESLYVIETGEVRVLKRFAGRPSIEVARLGPGAVIGEIAVMSDRRRHATVEALGEVRVLEIDRGAVATTAAAHGELATLLEAMVRERLLSNLMAVAPFFAALPAERRPELLARFRPRKVASGAVVIEQGLPRHGLFLVLLGALDVSVRRADGRTARIATIGEGGHVGELGLMSDDPEPATVIALGPTELVVLPPNEFYQAVADDPELWTALRADAQRRLAEIATALR
jgi:cAMP-dependent protein kinase regulator